MEGIEEKRGGADGQLASVMAIRKGHCISVRKFLGFVEVQGNGKRRLCKQ